MHQSIRHVSKQQLKQRFKQRLFFAAIALTSLFTARSAHATDWFGTLTNTWSTDGNWSILSAPGPSNSARFLSGNLLVVRAAVNLSGSTTVASMQVEANSQLAGAYSFTRTDNAVLTVNGLTRLGSTGAAPLSTTTFNGFRLNTGFLTLNGGATGVLTGGGVVTSSGVVELFDSTRFTLNSGTLNAANGININNAARLIIDSGGTLNMNSGTTMNLNGSTSQLTLNAGFAFNPGTTINVSPGADIISTSYIDIGNGGANTVNLNGADTFLIAAGPTASDWGQGASGFATVNLTNTAVADVQNLNIANGTGVALINISSGAVLRVNRTLNMGGGTLNRFVGMTIDGGLLETRDSVNLNNFADIDLGNGTARFGAGAVINAGARLDITGGTLEILNSSTLTVNGGTLTRAATFGELSNSATLRVQAGGTVSGTGYFDIANNNTFGALVVTGTGSSYAAGALSDWGRNAGRTALITIDTAGIANVSALRIGTNNGAATVNVNSAGQLIATTLEVGGGSTARTVNLSINGGTVTVNDATRTTTFNDKAVLNLQSGTFDPKGNVTFFTGATANWSGGSLLVGSGRTLAVNGGVINSTIAAASGLSPGATLAISNAGRFDATGSYTVGASGAGTVTVTGANSRLRTQRDMTLGGSSAGQVANVTTTTGGSIFVGDNALGFVTDWMVISDNNAIGSGLGGKLTIQNGSTLNHHSRVIVSSFTNTFGEVQVTGANSQFTIGELLIVGNNGTGLVTVSAGGKIKTDTFQFSGPNSKIVINAGGVFEANSSMTDRVRTSLLAGFNGGNWLGASGITSSDAAANTTRSLGYVDANGLVTVKFTLGGDANLSNNVDFNDLVLLARNFNQGSKFWIQGDFNYNGLVDFNDLVILARNFNSVLSGGQIQQLNSGGGDFMQEWDRALAVAATVPEPTTLTLLAGTCVLGIRRRGKKQM